MSPPFVPESFEPPASFRGTGFRLEPLDVQHNESDHDAWMSSIDHIRATPGFEEWSWPAPMSLDANRVDLERHADDFANRRGFTYTILEGSTVIGCVYMYPPADGGAYDVSVRSWVRATHRSMDVVVWKELSAWIADSWPFRRPHYASRA